MRKIEHNMNRASLNTENWHVDNTRVWYDPETSTSHVYLHHNKIAEVGNTEFRLFDGGHQTQTTKSRLNAILDQFGKVGEGVFQKNWNWFFRCGNGEEIPFQSGMLLE